MNPTPETIEETDDIAIEVQTNNEPQEEPMPAGRRLFTFVGIKVEETPGWKLEKQRLYKPDKEPDTYQWRWMFKHNDPREPQYIGRVLYDWQPRSWHEKSNSAKYLAALLGKPKLDGTEQGGTKRLEGRDISLRVTLNKDKNYSDPNGAEPAIEAPAKPTEPDEAFMVSRRLELKEDLEKLGAWPKFAKWYTSQYQGPFEAQTAEGMKAIIAKMESMAGEEF